MRIVAGLIPHKTPDGWVAVATGEAAKYLNGMLRLNETAASILRALEQETTEEAVVEAILGEYEIDPDTAKRDVLAVLDSLRQAHLLIEA